MGGDSRGSCCLQDMIDTEPDQSSVFPDEKPEPIPKVSVKEALEHQWQGDDIVVELVAQA